MSFWQFRREIVVTEDFQFRRHKANIKGIGNNVLKGDRKRKLCHEYIRITETIKGTTDIAGRAQFSFRSLSGSHNNCKLTTEALQICGLEVTRYNCLR